MHDLSMTLAHAPASPATIWGAWALEPAVVAAIVVAGWLYARGAARLPRGGPRSGRARTSLFALGLGALAAALLSPLHALAEALFSAHMVQHLALMLIAAPLLVAARPSVPFLLSLPPPARRMFGAARRLRPASLALRATGSPVVVGGLNAVVMWSWHLPRVYEAALADPLWHAAEHASFLGSALLLWTLVARSRTRRRPTRGAALLLLFVVGLQSAALGAVLTFAARPLYPSHAGASAWGLDPLTDQQLAGLIMWVPAGMVYGAAMAGLFLSWLRAADRPAHPAVAVRVGDRS